MFGEIRITELALSWQVDNDKNVSLFIMQVGRNEIS